VATDVRVRFGLIYTHLAPPADAIGDGGPGATEAHWAELLEHISWAEQLGFESVWLSERHFSNYPPSPLILAAAIAARTSTMRIGTNLVVAPLHHPLRLAEDAAMVATLSQGRFDLGIGQGHRAIDFEAFGVNIRHRPSLLEETASILRLAWRGEPFSFTGRRYQIEVPVAVRPLATSAPRVLIGATSEPGMARAARIADGFLSAFNGNIRQFTEIAGQLGQGEAMSIFAAQQAIIAADPQREWAAVGQAAMNHVNQNLPPEHRLTDPDQAVARKMVAVWEGAEAVERIVRLIQRHPTIEDVHFLAVAGPGESLDHTRPRLEYLAEVVIPQVRSQLASSAAATAQP
jgi:alkanesulfonate monooxygenase SsuD/methylene tetrahydromethanopterin reductase-like flavin-dependent oxidoreductase (luciferase family)